MHTSVWMQVHMCIHTYACLDTNTCTHTQNSWCAVSTSTWCYMWRKSLSFDTENYAEFLEIIKILILNWNMVLKFLVLSIITKCNGKIPVCSLLDNICIIQNKNERKLFCIKKANQQIITMVYFLTISNRSPHLLEKVSVCWP